ncbi:MAG: hypothetical protein GY792_37830 [Gammaproteobacteria bacterium]|nr:hypothetical protein [Gammaproteobacteria bacterium]
MNRQQRADQRSKAFHIRIAAKLRADPELWTIPRQNLQRWEKTMGGLSSALYEWSCILQTSSKEETLTILESDSEEAKRLRSSSPFTGILTRSERQEIIESFKQFT